MNEKEKLDTAALFCGFGAHNQEKGNYEIAIDQFEKALKENPKYDIAWNNLGNSYRSLRKYEKALGCYEKAIECSPENPMFYLHKGVLLMELGRFSEAEPYMNKVVKLDSSNLDAMFHMANISEQIENYGQAAFFAQMCLKMSPGNPPIVQCFARNLFLQGTEENSHNQLDKYITYPNNDLSWYIVIPTAMLKQNKHYEIDNYFKSLNTRFDTNYFDWIKGAFYQNKGEDDRAMETHTKNLEKELIGVSSRFNLAQLLFKKKNYHEALTHIEKCISEGGNQRAYHDLKMVILEKVASKEEVLSNVTKMIALFPDDPLNINFRYGLYLKSQKLYHEAIKTFEMITDPNSGWSDYQIGICYNLLGETENSLDHLKKAFSLDRSCRDDARFYPELDNLRDNERFQTELTFFPNGGK